MAEEERVEPENALPYHYDALPKRAIRLLQIPEQSICQPWSLTAYDLHDYPSYICLSYTWGPHSTLRNAKQNMSAQTDLSF